MELSTQSNVVDFSYYSEFADEFEDGMEECGSEDEDEESECGEGGEGERHFYEEDHDEDFAMEEVYWQGGSASSSCSDDHSSKSGSWKSSHTVAISRSARQDTKVVMLKRKLADADQNNKENNEKGDEDEEEMAIKRRKAQASVTLLLASSTEMLRIRFPYQSLSIRFADFMCLQENDYLNDTIVDFYLNHIVEHLLPEDPTKRVTVLPSTFWHNLSLRQTCLPDDFEQLKESDKEDARFGDILEFLTDFELFDVDYLLVPVNEWEHWSLIIVCHPFSERAAIVTFDSQPSDSATLNASSNLIGDFLSYAYLHRRGTRCPTGRPRTILPRNVVQQANAFDCGVYALEFAKRFLLQPPKDLTSFDFATEYADFSVAEKRAEMQRTILALCANRHIWENVLQLVQQAPRIK